MIEDIQLFTKPNNQIDLPNENWDSIHKIYVSGILNLGLTDKATFDQHKAPTLIEIINFIHGINHTYNGNQISYEFNSKEGKIRIEYIAGNCIRILRIINKKHILITEKYKFRTKSSIDQMTYAIWKQIVPLNRRLRNVIATSLFAGRNNLNYIPKVWVGDKVKTTKHVATSRKGLVYEKINHIRDQKTYTTIIINGKPHNRKYEDHELELDEEDEN